MLREYKVISIEEYPTDSQSSFRIRLNILANEIDRNQVVELNNISLPSYVRVGDLIRWAEHNFYDVIDEDGNFLYK